MSNLTIAFVYTCSLRLLIQTSTTKSSNLTVCTDIGYKVIALIAKTFAGMSSKGYGFIGKFIPGAKCGWRQVALISFISIYGEYIIYDVTV